MDLAADSHDDDDGDDNDGTPHCLRARRRSHDNRQQERFPRARTRDASSFAASAKHSRVPREAVRSAPACVFCLLRACVRAYVPCVSDAPTAPCPCGVVARTVLQI